MCQALSECMSQACGARLDLASSEFSQFANLHAAGVVLHVIAAIAFSLELPPVTSRSVQQQAYNVCIAYTRIVCVNWWLGLDPLHVTAELASVSALLFVSIVF